MNSRNKDNHDLDNLLRDVLKKAINNQQVPPDAKDRVRKKMKLEQHVSRSKPKRLIVTYYAAAALCLFLLSSVMFPNAGSALNIGLLKKMEFLIDHKIFNTKEVYKQDTESNNSKTIAPKDVETQVQKKFEEATEKIPFTPLVPRWLPEGITLTDVKVIGEGTVLKLILKYSDKQLIITQMGFCDTTSVGVSYDKEDSIIENLMVRGKEGALIKLKNSHLLLKWAEQGIFYQIEGDITAEEIKKIAKNLIN